MEILKDCETMVQNYSIEVITHNFKKDFDISKIKTLHDLNYVFECVSMLGNDDKVIELWKTHKTQVKVLLSSNYYILQNRLSPETIKIISE